MRLVLAASMLRKHYKLLLKCALAIPFIYLLDFCGLLTHLLEQDFETHFYYPLRNDTPTTAALLTTLKFVQLPAFTAASSKQNPPRLTILVKSAIGHKQRRAAIRKTWGYESRFSDVHIRCAFLLGMPADGSTDADIVQETQEHADIVRADFTDSYFNNTIKTMVGLRWASQHFNNSDYYMFVDDDYYVSIKNVLRFLGRAHIANQHSLLFAGYVFQSAPLRHKFSKWYVSLAEYPFDKWPPYVTAGAFILSRDALLRMYKVGCTLPLFRFDDVYLGIVALKAHIAAHHCDGFYFHRPRYTGPDSYSGVIATHGFSNPSEMEAIWNECRSANYA